MARGRAPSAAQHHPSSSSSSLNAHYGPSSNDTHLRRPPGQKTVAGPSTSPTQIYRSSSAQGSRNQEAIAPQPAMPLTSPNRMFDRITRKLSKKGKSPAANGSSGARRGSSSTSDQPHSDPPSYNFAVTGVTTPTSPYPSTAHKRAMSRQEREPERQPRVDVPEWGPPPLTDPAFQRAQIEQEEAVKRAAMASPPQRTGSISRRFGTQKDKQRQVNSPSHHHHASASAAQTPPTSNYATLGSRSFDSLVQAQGDARSASEQTAAPLLPRRDSDGRPCHPTSSSGNRTGASDTTTPATVNPGAAAASGVTRRPTISSTARAKPTREGPMAKINSSYFPAGFSLANRRSSQSGEADGPSSSQPSQLTEEELQQRAREREELVGKGPYWSVQRGWRTGVVTSQAEAEREVYLFPGPVLQKFGADELDEALAFYYAGREPCAGRNSADGDDEDTETSADEMRDEAKRDSKTSIALGRSVSLMDRKPQSQRQNHTLKHKPRGAQQSMSEAVKTGPNATPQVGPVRMTQRHGSVSGSPGVPALLANATRAQVNTILFTQDLLSLVNFYSSVVGMQVLSHLPNQQAVLAVPMSGATVQVRVFASLVPPTSTSCFCLSVDLPLDTIRTRFEATMQHHRGERERRAVEGQPVEGQAWHLVELVHTGREDELTIRDPSGHLIVFALKNASYSPTAQLPPLLQGSTSQSSSRGGTPRDSPRMLPQPLPGMNQQRISPRDSPRLAPQANSNMFPRRALSPSNPFQRPRGGSSSLSRPVSPAALSSVGEGAHVNPFLGSSSSEDEVRVGLGARSAPPQPVPIPPRGQADALQVSGLQISGTSNATATNPHLSINLGSPFSGLGGLGDLSSPSAEPVAEQEEAQGMTTSRSDRTIVPGRVAGWTRVVDESD